MDLPRCAHSLRMLHEQLRAHISRLQAAPSADAGLACSWLAFARGQSVDHHLYCNLYRAEEGRAFWQPWLDLRPREDAGAGKSAKQLPTAKWKRDRRTRPEYVRRCDAKGALDAHHDLNGAASACNGASKPSSTSSAAAPASSSAAPSPASAAASAHRSRRLNGALGGEKAIDAPLDMTTTPRQRGLPPSYSQAISDPSFRSTYTGGLSGRPSANGRDDLPTGISMCDPIIDEHFRRSLGKDYNAVFNNNAKETKLPAQPAVPQRGAAPPSPDAPAEQPPAASAPSSPPLHTHAIAAASPAASSSCSTPAPVASVIEMMDASGLSVDDHFAKALGDTWHRLNRKDAQAPDGAAVNAVTSSATEVV